MKLVCINVEITKEVNSFWAGTGIIVSFPQRETEEGYSSRVCLVLMTSGLCAGRVGGFILSDVKFTDKG